MNWNIIGLITSIVVIIVCLLGVSNMLINSNKETEKLFEKIDKMDKVLLTSKVLIKTDTLEIIKTNWWDCSVTLENNIQYSYNYIESRLLGNSKFKIDSINDEYDKRNKTFY